MPVLFFSQPVVLVSFLCRFADQFQYDWIVEKIWTSNEHNNDYCDKTLHMSMTKFTINWDGKNPSNFFPVIFINRFTVALLDQIFFSDPVIFESICYRTRAKQLINESKTTGGLRKIGTGIADRLYSRPDIFLRSSRNRVNLLLYDSKTTDKREQSDWMAKKYLDGLLCLIFGNCHKYITTHSRG